MYKRQVVDIELNYLEKLLYYPEAHVSPGYISDPQLCYTVGIFSPYSSSSVTPAYFFFESRFAYPGSGVCVSLTGGGVNSDRSAGGITRDDSVSDLPERISSGLDTEGDFSDPGDGGVGTAPVTSGAGSGAVPVRAGLPELISSGLDTEADILDPGDGVVIHHGQP